MNPHQNNDQLSTDINNIETNKLYPFYKKKINTNVKEMIIKIIYMHQTVVAIGFTQIIPFATTWNLHHISLDNNILASVKLGGNQLKKDPDMVRSGQSSVVILLKLKDKLQLFSWDLNTYQIQKIDILINMNVIKFLAFNQTRLICLVLQQKDDLFNIIYFKVADKQLHFRQHHKGTIKLLFKNSFWMVRKVNQHSTVIIAQDQYKQSIDPLIFQIYSLDIGIDNLKQVNFDHQFNKNDYLARSILDVWQIDHHKLYIQVRIYVKDYYFNTIKENQLEQLHKQEKYVNYIWNIKNRKIKNIKFSQLDTQPHRIQFINSLRQVDIYHVEGLSLEWRANQSRAMYSLTGFPVNYERPWQKIPVYFYNLLSKTLQGVYFLSEPGFALSWSAYEPNTLVIVKNRNGLALWKLPSSITFGYDVRLLSTTILVQLIKQCDQDLLAQVCALLSSADTKKTIFQFQLNKPK